MFSLLLFLSSVVASSFERRQNAPQHSRCRFAFDFTQDQLMQNSTDFENNMFYCDGQFHRDGVGYDHSTGTTIDHVLLGYATGLPDSPPDMISNPRNEAYHIMLLTHAIANDSHASTFTYPANPADAAEWAAAVLNTKLLTYITFNNTYPGYGGFLPTFEIDTMAMEIRPVNSSNHTVSALDNGYLVWALYSLIQVLDASPVEEFRNLSVRWTSYFVYLRDNAKGIFLHGPQLGSICATSTLLPETLPYASAQKYACEDDSNLLDHPYSGELMAWFVYFSRISATEGQAIWDVKRPQLQATNYTGSIVDTSHTRGTHNYSGSPIAGRHIFPISTQKGLYFGAQEHLKLLFLPYLDIPIVNRVMKNAERVRTCNSVLMARTPGLFAAVTNATSPTEQGNIKYVYNSGIPSISFNTTQEQDIITPYAAFATILFERGVGLSWYHNALNAKCMQSVYGSVNSIRCDGSAVSRIVSWETKAPVLLALLGGITGFVRDGLKRDGVLPDFLELTGNEYGMVFDEKSNGGMTLMGEDVPLCLPSGVVSGLGLQDYSTCNLKE